MRSMRGRRSSTCHFTVLRRVLLLGLALCCGACGAGAYLTPTAYAPMLREKGETRVNAGFRPDARRGMYLKAVLAASEHVRVGLQVAGASMTSDGSYPWEDPDTRLLATFYSEGALGFELPRGRFWRGGLMALFGYGSTESVQMLCREQGGGDSGCRVSVAQQFSGGYTRFGLQGHVGLAHGTKFHVALGFSPVWVRLYAEEIDFQATSQRNDLVALEPFFVARLEYGWFSLEVQPRASFLVGSATDAEGDRLATDPRFFLVISLGLHTPVKPRPEPLLE